MARTLTQLPGFNDLADFLEYVEARAAEFQAGAASPGDAAAAADTGAFGGLTPLPNPDAEADAAATAAEEQQLAAAARRRKRQQKREEEAAAAAAEAAARAAAAAEAEAALRPWVTPDGKKAIAALEGMGAHVYLPGDKKDMDWGILAG
jgi:hypothetical protein